MNAYPIVTIICCLNKNNQNFNQVEKIFTERSVGNLKCMAEIIQFRDIGQKVMISSN